MRPLALKWRLSLLMAAALTVTIVATCISLYIETRELFKKQTDQSLLGLARAAANILEDSADSTATLKLSGLLATHNVNIIARISRGDTVVFATPPAGVDWDKAGSAPSKSPQEHRFFFLPALEDEYRCVRMKANHGGDILIAQSTQQANSELQEVLYTIAATGAIVIAAMVGLVILLAQIGLRPISVMAGKLRGIDADNVAHPNLAIRSVPEELVPFAHSLSQLLHRLNKAMMQQKAFIADASHELRTPVTVAKTTIQTTLAQPRSAEEYHQSLQDTLDDLRRMERLVNELLLLARLEEPSVASPHSPVQLDAVLAELADSFGDRAAEAGNKLACSLSPAVIPGDEVQLNRLFSNLLDNALRYGPRGGTIRLESKTRANHVAITVRDEGGNIPADAIPHLFERFYRADASRSSSTGGAGLGLAIVREIALRHGGTIEISSDPANGTLVTVTFPLLPEK